MGGSIIGLGVASLGDALNFIGASQSEHAVKSEFEKELALQQGYSNKLSDAFYADLNLRGADEANKELATGKTNRLNSYQALQKGNNLNGVEAARVNESNQARAEIGSYSDWKMNQTINQIKLNEAMARWQERAQSREQNIYPYEMRAATEKGLLLQNIGGLINGLSGGIGNISSGSGSAATSAQQANNHMKGSSSTQGQPSYDYNNDGSGYNTDEAAYFNSLNKQ